MREKQRLAIGAACLMGIIGGFIMCVNHEPSDDKPRTSRQMSVALPDGKCEITLPKPSEKPIDQTYAASFPGSGARMARHLVEALTGLVSASERSHGGKRMEVTIKTHYPHRAGRPLPFDGEISRGFVLLRNPHCAIPSFHNFKYEQWNKLENHSTRAPVEDWLEWRTDDNFDFQLRLWQIFVEHWMDRLEPDNRIVISYEDLTDAESGPKVSAQLADFLDDVDGVDTISRDSVDCVWRKVVNYKEEEDGADVGSLRSGPKERPYTKRQLDAFIDVLKALKEKYPSEDSLNKILDRYIADIEKMAPSDKVAQRRSVS